VVTKVVGVAQNVGDGFLGVVGRVEGAVSHLLVGFG